MTIDSRFEFINPADVAPPSGYNNGVSIPLRAGSRLLVIAGQVGSDAKGNVVSDGFVDQFDQALANLLRVVGAAGGTAENVIKLTIFVVDMAEYVGSKAAIGAAYRRLMGRHFPAMTLVEVKSLVEAAALVEIEGLALVEHAATEDA
jgi:enamine deaminase RidA (YjgF/YER057c/UK114 family)